MLHFLPAPRRSLVGLVLVLLTLLPGLTAVGQTVPLYSFTSTLGTYTPLTGDTLVDVGVPSSGGGGSTDDGYSAPITLPFPFRFGTSIFNTVTLNTNGYLGIGTHTTQLNLNVLQGAENNVVAYSNVDLESVDSTAYSVVTTGSAPNRIFKMQASYFQRYNGVGGVGKLGNAQVWLFEGSNNIEIHFGAYVGPWGNTNFDSVRVGLRGVSTTDLAAVTGTWTAPTKVNSIHAGLPMDGPGGVLPANGQIFRFLFPTGTDLTPPTIGPVTLAPPAPACTPTAHVVSIHPTDPSGILSAWLTYSVGSAAATSVPMTSSGSTWSATIPAQGTSPVSYTISVTDASPQQNQSTSTAAAYADGLTQVHAGPDQTITTGATATLQATGNPNETIKISEFTLNNGGTGRTTPRPPYVGNDDDFVELANIGTVTVNLAGYHVEVVGGGAGAARFYTFPAGVTLQPHGVLVLHLGPGTDQPTSHYYHTGGTEALSSGDDVGFVLSAPNGQVLDAVAVNNYAFGNAVPGTEWTGLGAASPGGFAGAGLTGTDTDSRSGWTTASTTVPQTLGAYNAGLSNAPLPTVTWTGGVLTGAVTTNPLTTPVHPNTGTFTYTARLTQNGCTVIDQVAVTVINPVAPVADFTASATTVSQTDVVSFLDLSTNLPSAWQWTFSPSTVTFVGGTSATSRNPQVTFTTAGCYTVTLTASNGAGSSTRTKASYVCVLVQYCNTIQGAACSPSGAYLDAVRILNTTLDNSGTGCSTGTTSYTVYPAAGNTTATLQAGQSYSLQVTSSATGSVVAWIDYNANGSFGQPEYINVMQTSTQPTPVTTTVQFTVPANAVGGLVGLRVRNSATANSIGPADACVQRFTGETEDYYLTVLPACNLAAPSVSNSGPVCPGSTLTLSSTNVPAGSTYAWTGPNNFTSTAAQPSIPNVTAASAGAYTLVISRNGCSSPPRTTNVVINTPPAAPGPLSGSRCGPGSVALVYTSVPAGVTYRWYTTPTGGTPIAGAGTTFNTPSLSATTTYYVSAVKGGCESPRTGVAATINPLPATPTLTAGGPTTFCLGSSVVLTASPGAGLTYTFKRNNTVITGTSGNTYTATAGGTYTVTVTNASGCSATSANVSLTTATQSSAAFAYSTSTFCKSNPTTPTPSITGTQGGTFRATPTGLALNPSTGQITVASSPVGNYTVTYAVTGSCPASQSQVITITNASSATFSYVSPSCVGQTGTLLPRAAAGSSIGRITATPVGLVLTPGNGAINLATSQPGTYTLTNSIAASGTCTAASATTTLTLVALPTAAITAGGPTTFCQGDSVTLTATGGPRFQWSTGDTTATLKVKQSGTYTVTSLNAAGCQRTSAPTVVTVNPRASAAFAYSASGYCLSDTTAAPPAITGTPGGLFSVTPGGLTLDPLTGRLHLSGSRAGTYTVTYAVGGPCPASQSHTLLLTTPAQGTFAYATNVVCVGTTGTLTPTLAFGSTAGTFSATPVGLTLDPATGAVTVGSSLAGNYTVTNTVAAGGACSANASTATVTVSPLPVVVLTNLSTSYCQSDPTVTLTGTVNGTPGLGIFTLDGQPATQLNPSVLTPGPHAVTLSGTNAAGCANTTQQNVNIVATPPQPTFTTQPQNPGVLLTSSSATGNQWFLNGTPIAGATGPTYLVNTSAQYGNYTVQVTLGGCASAPSLPQAIVLTGTGASAGATALSLYPNPTPDGRLTLELTGPAQPVRLEVLDAVGRRVYQAELPAAPGAPAQHTLDLHALPTGVYTLRVVTADGAVVRRLVRE